MSNETVSKGNLVSLVYSICDGAGNLLEQSDLTVTYIHGGKHELIGGMDEAVSGRRAGDSVVLALEMDKGFGLHDPSLTFTGAIENVPPQFRRVGAEAEMQSESGDVKIF